MATQAPSTLSNVTELLKAFGVGSGPTTTTSTTGQNISPAALQAIIKQSMEGIQGLSAIGAGQRTAGLYNSSTAQLLTNDLMTRASGEAARLSTPTTTTQTVQAPRGNPLASLGVTAGVKFLESDAAKRFGNRAYDYIFGSPSIASSFSSMDAPYLAAHDSFFSGYGSDVASDFIGNAGSALDTGLNYLDTAGGAIYDTAASIGNSLLNYGSGALDYLGDFFSSLGFARGGRVPMQWQQPVKGYAQGGRVTPRRSSPGLLSESGIQAAQDLRPVGVRSTSAPMLPGVAPVGALPDMEYSEGAPNETTTDRTTGYSISAREAVSPVLSLLTGNPLGMFYGAANIGTQYHYNMSPLELVAYSLGMYTPENDTGPRAYSYGAVATPVNLSSRNDGWQPTALTNAPVAEESTNSGGWETEDSFGPGAAGDPGTGFSDQGAAEGFAAGGRVKGDRNYGTDDVPAIIAGKRPAALDGGEFVLNARSTQIIDKMYPGLLDTLNNLGVR